MKGENIWRLRRANTRGWRTGSVWKPGRKKREERLRWRRRPRPHPPRRAERAFRIFPSEAEGRIPWLPGADIRAGRSFV